MLGHNDTFTLYMKKQKTTLNMAKQEGSDYWYFVTVIS